VPPCGWSQVIWPFGLVCCNEEQVKCTATPTTQTREQQGVIANPLTFIDKMNVYCPGDGFPFLGAKVKNGPYRGKTKISRNYDGLLSFISYSDLFLPAHRGCGGLVLHLITPKHTYTHACAWWDSSGQEISSSQRSLLVQHTIVTRDRHQCLRRDSNPKSQQASGRRPMS